MPLKNKDNNNRGHSIIYNLRKGTPINEDTEDDGITYEPGTIEKVINIILCRPDANKIKLSAKPVTIFKLFRYAKTVDIILLTIGLITTIFSGAAQPVMSILTGRLTSAFIIYPPTSLEFRIAAYENVYILLGIGVFVLTINYIQYMCFSTVCNRIVGRLRKAYMASILRQNAGWFDKNQAGVLTTRLNDNIDRIKEGLGDKLGLLLRGFFMYLSALIIAFSYEWRLALMMLGVTPLSCIIMSLMSQFIGNTTKKELINVGQAGAIAEETLLSIKTVQSFNGQEERINKYKNELKKTVKYTILNGVWSGLFGGIFFLMLFVYLGCGMLYGTYLLKVEIFETPGDIFTVVMGMMLGAYFLGLISPHLMVILNARVAAAEIYKTIDRIPPIDCYSNNGKILTNVEGKVEFKNVHFRYPTRKEHKILNGINIVINPGETVAFVGHSGCGKSTSVGLLTRLYEIEEGSITIDGIDIKNINIECLRNIIGIVQQEPILFTATLAENIQMGNPNISREDMIKVCRMANATEFIDKLPDGYDTLIGEGGVQLSGGMKQRIAIARTLARNPKILLLDEATSALDTKSESIVQSALNNAAIGRSSIIIAHRLSTIKNADKIVVFDKGNIIEQGTHNELITMGGKYSELVKAQQFDTTENDDEDDNNKDDKVSSNYDIKSITSNHDCKYCNKCRKEIFSRRSSVLSGREVFIRGTKFDSSFGESNHKMSQLGITDLGFTPTEAFKNLMIINENDERKKEQSANILTIYKNASEYYCIIFFGFIIAAIRGFELPAVAILFSYIFKILENVKDKDLVKKMAFVILWYGIVGVGTCLFQLLSSIIFSYCSSKITLKYRIAAFRNILYQDGSFFDQKINSPGELITRLATDVPNIRSVLDGRILQIIYALSAVITCIAMSFIYSWEVSTLGTGLIIVLGVTQTYLAYTIHKKNIESVKKDEAGKIAIEAIENIKTVQLLTRSKYFVTEYANAISLNKDLDFSKSKYEAVNFALSQTFQYIVFTAGFAVAIHVINIGNKTPSETFQSLLFMLLGAVSIMNASTYFPEMIKANSAAKTLFKLIKQKSGTGDLMEGDQHNVNGDITFSNIIFTYPTRKDQLVMNGLSFEVKRGQTIAIVGPSGSGKSTTIAMLERFYDPMYGDIKIDKKDLRSLSLYHLRKQMALVGQEPRLFSGTIKENICFGLKNVSIDKINEALEIANCKNFISLLPDGIDTEVGEKGSKLSGGQKQRIAIARALVRDPKILLLDEATSALDSESEKAVQEALDKARQNRTCITICHRLSSIVDSDLIIYVSDGKVRESGKHMELIKKKGYYYELLKQQNI
ncbi:LP14331p [Strongyloides ratti]|uniref:LP14331p n=1 Tax=Strongyloides ratti TaxID=34506 RepID=A0A090LQ77_STRRB|nr:LP14331p [Strongyloides ratti]CEF69681.1 LP14331p [Strongyloides ratti]